MGGQSSQQSTQSSQSAPWAPAQPLLQGVLANAQQYVGQTGITPAQTAALNSVEANAAGTNQFTPAINASTASLLAGGGALNQAGAVQGAYNTLNGNTAGLANNTNYNPLQTPGMADALAAINGDITRQVNGSFAAAGRMGSGYNQQALARGLSQGEGQLLTNQYNQNVQNQQGAAQNLFNAAQGSNSLLSGLQQQAVANQQAGVNQVGTGFTAANTGNSAVLAAEAQRLGIPIQNLSLLSGLGTPIASLGGQTSGTSDTTNQMSGAQQFATILGGIGSVIPRGPMSFKF